MTAFSNFKPTHSGGMVVNMNDSTAPVIENETSNTLNTGNLILLAGTFLLGLLFVFLFYGKPFGISCLLFILAFYAITLLCTGNVISYKAGFGWLLAIPVLMLSLTFFIYGNEFFRLLNLLVLPLLIMLQTLLVAGGNRYGWSSPGIIIDMLTGIFYRCFAHMVKPFRILARFIRGRRESRMNPAVGKVLIGLLVSVPLVVIVIALLSSADMVFGIYLDKIPNLFKSFKIEELAARTFLVFLIFLLSFSYLWSLSHKEMPGGRMTDDLAIALPRSWDSVITMTVMVVIDTVYVAFVAIQFAYLFGGASFALPSDFTFSEYARRGFFELITVTLINIALLAAFIGLTKKGGSKNGIASNILYTLMTVCTLIMLFSAHFRMSLYEEAYGYTYLRMLTHAFMAFLAVLFAITLFKIWIDRMSLLKPYIITAVIAFVIVNYMNVDVLIARGNIDRFYKTGKIDVAYLTGLSNDAVPEIARLAGCKDLQVAEAVGKYLDEKKKELSKAKPWQSFNIAESRARKALQ